MADDLRHYKTGELEVTWSAKRCIHFRACVRGLPEVFDVGKRPWVQPDRAAAEEVVAVVHRCPTGALHAFAADGAPLEPALEENRIRVAQDGPLYLSGQLRVVLPGGEVLADSRVALCRCGASQNKPFCDSSHAKLEFKDSGALGKNRLNPQAEEERRPLTVQLRPDGPYRLSGPVRLEAEGGLTVFEGRGGTLCRCGHSSHKPFCDGTHEKIGFAAEGSAEREG